MPVHPHPLLELCDRVVARQPVPGFHARLAFGVRRGDGTSWWEVDCSAVATARYVEAPAPACDGTLLLGQSEADTILASGELPERPEVIELSGDASLLVRFVERYLIPKSPLAVRLAR